jgi:uroporphyrinogen-III decarboxylase
MSETNGKVFPDDELTSRQRLLAAYRGDEVDRLPYWAKVTNPTWRAGQPEAVRNWSNEELLAYIHADGLVGVGHGAGVVRPHVRSEHSTEGNVETRVTHTPDGDLAEQWTRDPYTASWHPTEFPVRTLADLARFRWVYTDLQYPVNEQAVSQSRARCTQVGERGVTLCGWGTSPLMHLVEHVIGPVNVHLMLQDHPGEVDELIELMHAANVALVRTVARTTAADLVCSVENTSTTLISPTQFHKYSYQHLRDYGTEIESAGKLHELHMCGHTRVLLEEIDTIPAASIEAYTSPTLGNTRLVDGRTDAPSKTLVGGTNVNVWLWPLEKIQQYIAAELAACPDNRRTVLTTAGVAPPGCPAEKFRAVGEWIRTVPVRM